MHQEFNGIIFTPDKKGYYRATTDFTLYLHRVVWEYHNTKIPDGYEIHHIDFYRSNNDISNLQLLTIAEHKKLHGEFLTDEQRVWRRTNLIQNAQPEAVKWHKSAEGREWHRQLINQQHKLGTFKHKLVCTNCGKSFIGEKHTENTFCSGACKSAYRRKNNTDTVERVCAVCEKPFSVNKYKKTKTCSRSCANKLWHRRGN